MRDNVVTEFPNVRFYVHSDGAVTVSEHQVWVSAAFESLDAAKSWAGHMLEAEAEFAKLNAATGGKGPLLLGQRPIGG
jgi:hypothetical protein